MFFICDFLFLSFSGIYNLFSFKQSSNSTENTHTQISSKRLLTQLQNFKVITTRTKKKREEKFFLFK